MWTKAPKAPPSVAQAERRREQLAAKQQREQRCSAEAAQKNVLDRCIANPIDMVVAGEPQEYIQKNSHWEHAKGVAKIGIGNALKSSLQAMQCPNERGGCQAHGSAQRCIEQEHIKRRWMLGDGRQRWHIERRSEAEEKTRNKRGGSSGQGDR
jgi:hypothetical protein